MRDTDVKQWRSQLPTTTFVQDFGFFEEGMPLLRWKQEGWKQEDNLPSMRRALPGVDIRICEQGTYKAARLFDIGNLHIGGSSVDSTYVGRKEASYKDLLGIKWFDTGKQARMDREGYV